MNTALQAIVVPALRARGFKGSLPHFRRITASHIHLLTFQFDRYGGGFVIEAAIAPNQPFETRWGRIIEPNELSAHDLDARCRIHPSGILENSSTDDWFRYDKRTLFRKNIFKKLAQRACDNLHLAEDYWREKGA
ncbi:MAG: DUF4304 domain-containing protein [Desulfobacterales bacterium]|nr:DUF4304 domain-containing protein [Desulfobacterales bacterium]